MRFRYLLLVFVVVFAATLAVIVGETLSSEAMSVMVGVVAGVGASIPTSLLVLWFSLRTAELRAVAQAPGPVSYPMEPPEPRIVVVTPPAQPHYAPQPAYAGAAPGQAYGYGYEQAPSAPPALPAPVQRRFTVVGGYAPTASDGFVMGEPQYQEVAWQR
jgi:hypothetical protein